jgi:sugar/nucleoside kinase (ribokinase family)
MANRNTLPKLNLKTVSKKPICWGSGLLALDVILNGSPTTPPKLTAGGSCGNVMIILAYLGWDSYPIARLKNNDASKEILSDLHRWGVNTDFVLTEPTGSTQIIIHRILKNKKGQSVHRFEFRNPTTGNWFPGYKPFLSKEVPELLKKMPMPKVYYFDRVNRAAIDLAVEARRQGAVVFFEPSSIGDPSLFEQCLQTTDIIKFSNERIPDYKTLFKKSKVYLEIETLGKEGLNFRCKKSSIPKWIHIQPFVLSDLTDAAGAGDWCTAGIIDNLCREGSFEFRKKGIREIKAGLHIGQILGAINCFFDGARGIMYNVDKNTFRTVSRRSALKPDPLNKDSLFKSTKSTYKEFDLKIIEKEIFGS